LYHFTIFLEYSVHDERSKEFNPDLDKIAANISMLIPTISRSRALYLLQVSFDDAAYILSRYADQEVVHRLANCYEISSSLSYAYTVFLMQNGYVLRFETSTGKTIPVNSPAGTPERN
jgi:hypothetical protein